MTHTKDPAYMCWYNLKKRCGSIGTYRDATICDEWSDFQTFKSWYLINHREGFELDKDLKFPGNKYYSPETCLFIPKPLNLKLVRGGGVSYHLWSNRWRTHGIKPSGKNGVIKSSKSKEVCLEAYSEYLRNRYLVLCEEYPEYKCLKCDLVK